MEWSVYLLECARGVLYVGITPRVEERFAKHMDGKGATFTRINPPTRILGARAYPDRSSAARAEAALKKLTRSRKLAWAEENPWPPSSELAAP